MIPSPLTYRSRSALLIMAGLLIITVLWKKRLSHSIKEWRELDRSSERLQDASNLSSSVCTARAELQLVNAPLGDRARPPDAVWRDVLTEVARRSRPDRMELARVDDEHRTAVNGNSSALLPLTLRGTFTDLLRTTVDLQRSVPEAHAISLHFHTERGRMGGPPELYLTLYLRTITRHG